MYTAMSHTTQYYFTGVILKYDLKIAAFCRWSSRGFPKNDFSPLNS